MSQLEKAREMFKKDIYATEVSGIEIEEVAEGYARVSLVLDRRHRNAVGNVMGGVMYTIADFAFAVATNLSGNMTVTVSADIQYLSATKGSILYGETKLIKDGKRNCFYQVYITDDMDKDIALVTICGAHI